MFSWLNNRRSHKLTAEHLYGAVVAQARQPSFFTHLGVPDTLEGRYEVIVLNLFLVLDRLRGENEPAQSVSRRLTERFVTDMDDCMRELGVGDLKVPKKVKRAAAGLYDRVQDYHGAMTGTDEVALAKAIQRNVYTPEIAEPITSHATALADYIRRSHAAMAHQSLQEATSGTPRFADIVPLQANRADP
jgi:cytochrome b pre-mRNA-processing protein 3